MAIWRKVHEFKAGGHSRLKVVGHKVNGSVETCVAKPKVFSASMTSEHVTRRGRRGWADVVSDAVLEDELNLMSDDICCVPTALSTCSDARKQHCDGPSGQVNVIAHTRDPASLPVGPALLYTYSASVAHTPADKVNGRWVAVHFATHNLEILGGGGRGAGSGRGGPGVGRTARPRAPPTGRIFRSEVGESRFGPTFLRPRFRGQNISARTCSLLVRSANYHLKYPRLLPQLTLVICTPH